MTKWGGVSATDLKWYVWSNEHTAWWSPAGTGYTQNFREAGAYLYEEALKIVTDANAALKEGAIPNEIMLTENWRSLNY